MTFQDIRVWNRYRAEITALLHQPNPDMRYSGGIHIAPLAT